MRHTPIISTAITLVMAATCAIASDPIPTPDSHHQPYTIVATTGMVADIARAVAGDRAHIHALLGQGVDPHLYKTTRTDMQSMLNADVIFYSGLHLEGKMTDALIRVARAKPVYAITEEVEKSTLLEPPEFAGHFDPHLWMDPLGWSKTVEVVRDALTSYDASGADIYAANAETYTAKLLELHDYATTAIATIPQSTRLLITAHDAFNYFSRQYNIEVMGIQGISTESKAGVRDIERMVNTIVDRKITAIFVETTIAKRNILALIDGARAQGHHVIIGGSLFSDAMGAPGTYEGTYIGMIDHNITTIVRALGGQAPPKGMQGLLTPENEQ